MSINLRRFVPTLGDSASARRECSMGVPLSNLASFCESEVLDLPIEVVESQPRMNLVIVIQSDA